ncbi:MAG: zinc-dependent metalloprotease [Actinomycetota bacterium]|nr:zinc-dependent metalloprotease [Actinomycetota bacterium]
MNDDASKSRDRNHPPLIDEAVALRTATLVAPHYRGNPAQVAQLRARIAADVAAADDSARDWTGLGTDLPPTRVRVVSRTGWVQANLIGLRGAFDPLAERLAGRQVAARFVGWQVGTLLGLLSTKVLGQYILPLGGPGQAQLVLVGPNLLELSRRLGPLADDVRRVVLVHELAHRLQFDGVPWLGDHLRGLLGRYLESARLDPGAVLEALSRLPDALRALREERSITPLLQAVLSEEQRAVVDEAQALMSLLEGHGNATMYSAARGFVRDPDRVREALERRHSDFFGRLLTAVAGLDLKRRQYRDGEAFVRTVVGRVGTAGLNAAFNDPGSLPTLDEISAPETWLARVHGETVERSLE